MYPLSQSQHGLWLAEQLDPHANTYNDGLCFRLTGPFDVAAFARAAAAITRRQAALRTVFTIKNGQPVATVQERWPGRVVLTRCTEADRDRAAAAFAETALAVPFDLANGPVFRVEVLRFDAEDHVLVLALHHLVHDGWSIGVLLSELALHYAAALHGRDTELAPLRNQYSDYVLWERNNLTTEDFAKSADYWASFLAETATVLPALAERHRGQPDALSRLLEFAVPRPNADRLRALARDNAATIFMTTLAAWYVVLSRLAGVQDLLVGVPMTNRPVHEFDDVVGYFVNVLPLRANLTGDPSFAQLLRQTRETVLGGLANADLPFHQIVEVVNPDREPGLNPLVQVGFQLLDERTSERLVMPNVTVRSIEVLGRRLPFLLLLDVIATADGLSCRLSYSEAVFSAADASKLGEAYLAILAEVAERPDLRLSELSPATRPPSIDCARRQERQEDRPPPTSAVSMTGPEQIIAGVIADVLGWPRICRDDNFFRVGGHSLPAVQIVARVQELFGVQVSIRDLFDNPTVASFAAKVMTGRRHFLSPIESSGPRPTFPASFAQQRLWFAHAWDTDSAAYNMGETFRLVGPLDVDALGAAVHDLVVRQHTLRTRLVVERDAVQQVVDDQLMTLVPVSDVDGNSDEAHARARELLDRPYDLSTGPLFRVGLIRVAEADHVLVIGIHHVICDSWSSSILLRELTALYNAHHNQSPPALPPLPIQYTDYAQWQHSQLTSVSMNRQLNYWTNHIAGAARELGLIHPAPGVTAGGAERALRFTINAAGTAALRQLSRDHNATLFVTLLAAYQILLARIAHQPDHLIGIPTAARTSTETDNIIGLFVNLLPIRTNLTDNPTLRQHLRHTRTTTINALANANLPFEQLVAHVNPHRTPGITPLIQTTFQVFEEQGQMPLAFDGLDITVVHGTTSERAADVPLAMDVHCVGERLDIVLTYQDDLVDEADARTIANLYPALLRGVVRHPDTRVFELPFVDSAGDIVHSLGVGAGPPSIEQPVNIVEAFWAQVIQTPDACAVVDDADAWTFAQLGAMVRAVATAVGADRCRVAVAARRSRYLIAALLGAFASGAAVVPIELTDPADRTQRLLRLVGAEALVADRSGAFLAQDGNLPLVLLGELAEQYSPRGNKVRIHPEAVAAVLFTSGSTGAPKAIALRHKALGHLLAAHRAVRFGTKRRRVAFSASVAVDASLDQLLWLIGGHELHIVGDTIRRDSVGLLDFVRAHGIDVLDVPQSQVALLAEHGMFDHGHRPSMIMLGGEAVSTHVWRLLGEMSDVEAWNLYGPTECTIDGLAANLRDSTRPVIGRPIAGTHVHMLDTAGSAVPIGLVGEIYLGGALLAQGYLDRPALTAEHFVPDPWSATPGGRLYRTGDLGRFQQDGTVEFLGRADEQLKLRGFRVEPGEIDAALLTHPGVRDTATVRVVSAVGEAALCSYVATSTTSAELRTHLASVLPSYLLPSYLMTVPELPRTSSGKLDRRGLPDPVHDTEKFVAPRAGAEEIVAGVIADVLGLTAVGRDDNFFRIGGHSLLASRVVARLQECFETQVSIQDLFDHPTVASLTDKAMTGRRHRLPPIESAGPGPTFPASFAQQRLWYLHECDTDSAAYNMGDAFRLVGPLDIDALGAAIRDLIARQDNLRTRIDVHEGVLQQIVDVEYDDYVKVTDLVGATDGLGDLVQDVLSRHYVLSTGPLFRVDLIRVAEADHVLVIGIHHVICDGWSTGILLRELTALYNAHHDHTPHALPPLPVQYADYAQWQRNQLTDISMNRQLNYWTNHIARAPQILEWPGRRDKSRAEDWAKAVEFGFDPRETAALRQLSRDHNATLFVTLLAAYQILLARVTHQPDHLIGVPTAGRTSTETDNIIGLFVNLLPIRTNLTDNPTLRQHLRHTRTATINALANADLPFEQLVAHVNPHRTPGITPLIQTTFQVFEQDVDPEILMTGLDITPMTADIRGTRFELSLDIYRNGDGLRCWFFFDPALLDEVVVRELAEHYVAITQHAVAAPSAKTSELGEGYDPGICMAQADTGWTHIIVRERKIGIRTTRESTGRCALFPSVGEYPVYDGYLYHAMTNDAERNQLFADAVAKAAPTATVVELGTGPELLWARHAADAGAVRILAVESDRASASRAGQVAANRAGPRIDVVAGDALAVSLPVRADVCIAELVGNIAGAEGIASIIRDARRRHLNPGARIVPWWVGTRAAAVCLADLLSSEPAVTADIVPYVAAVLDSVSTVFDPRFCITGVSRADLRSDDQLVENLRLDDDVVEYAERLLLTITDPGRVDGLLLWAQLRCAEDQPLLDCLDSQVNWLPVYVPFDAEHPLPVEAGDQLELSVVLELTDGVHPDYLFDGNLHRSSGAAIAVSAQSRHSSGPFRASALHRALFTEETCARA